MAEQEGAHATVRYGFASGVARIELNRPEARNAIDGRMFTELLDALERADTDPAVRAIVLTGAGEKAFCAGADLAGFGGPDGTETSGEESRAYRLFGAFPKLGTPVIGRLAGHAIAGGLGLACSCDVVIAADDVKLGTPEVNVGLWPMAIMAVIGRSVGPKQALKLYYTGRTIQAPEAERVGLITEAVPRAELDQRVDELATEIAGKSPVALRLGRTAYYASRDMHFDEQLRYLSDELDKVAASEDAAEGIRAFTEKRSPHFTGR